ncbi:Glutamate receptor ionotropic, delta-1 [Portunus trituberculatus]|uniref:Glutamate receptor ionotropic, delta-1 n=1 Tax=Portunus trituberculatus TaxID=210409 RepID=A0A5B7H6K1_PORTR|nr:Glutamate receptor ionotropic, delta-1 [Portunus trituberculatus]
MLTVAAAAARAAILAGAATAMLAPREGEWPLEGILEEVVSGPFLGRPLVMYLDLAFGLSASLMARPTLRDVHLVLVDLKAPGGAWCQRQTTEVLQTEGMVHLALLGPNSRRFFEDLAAAECRWRPAYLLLVDAWGGSPDLLTDAAFERVEWLALLTTRDSPSVPPSVVIYSLFPFAQQSQVRQTGVWDANTSLTHLFVDRFPSFEGYQFQLATWLDDNPYLYQTTEDLEGKADGLQVEMLDALGHALNFTYTLTKEPPDLMWGDLEDEAWTGMLGMVHRGEKNFTVNFFGYSLDKTHAFDASSSYWMEGFGLTLLAPPPLPRWRAAYYPFQTSVWACGGATFLLVLLIWTLQVRKQQHKFFITLSPVLYPYR